MDENTKKLIKERFDALPESIQEVITSSNYEESLIEIAKKHELNVGQMGALEVETTLVMMGLTPTKDFETELTRELGVDKTKGIQIVNEINEKIFLKIRELLKLMNGETEEKPTTPTEKTEVSDTNKEEHEIMKSAGIEILPEKLEITGGEKTQPIFAEKLSTSVQSQTTKTEHTLDNISKTNIPETPPTNIEKPKIDPYREIPE